MDFRDQSVELIIFIGIEVVKNNDRSSGGKENSQLDVKILY